MNQKSFLAVAASVLCILGATTGPGALAQDDEKFAVGKADAGRNRTGGMKDLFVGNLFENFRNVNRCCPTVTVHRPVEASALPQQTRDIAFHAPYLGADASLEEFLEQSYTSAFLIVKDGAVIDERYFHGNHPTAKNASFSMGKSFVSALVGLAIADGYIDSVNDPVTKYLEELTADAFRGMTVKHVLQMSSGLAFSEDYTDPNSDLNTMEEKRANRPFIEYLNTLKRADPPGTVNQYVSLNTELLSILVARASGRSVANYLEEKIWMPMGMEHDALWVLDDGVETGMGGLAASLRDYARFGLLYLNEGRWNGQRILPEAWVRESVKPDSPHLQPGKNPKSDDELGYQYQWWTPRDTVEAFMALGIWGQSIYVNPGEGVVIVKLSADPTVFSTEVLYAQTEYFQALSKRISKLQP